jgi:hypothetical protein
LDDIAKSGLFLGANTTAKGPLTICAKADTDFIGVFKTSAYIKMKKRVWAFVILSFMCVKK